MKDDGQAPSHETSRDYRYEVRQEPKDHFLKRYMNADEEFKSAYGPDQFEHHHAETLQEHPIPHYPTSSRWPLIVNDSNPKLR